MKKSVKTIARNLAEDIHIALVEKAKLSKPLNTLKKQKVFQQFANIEMLPSGFWAFTYFQEKFQSKNCIRHFTVTLDRPKKLLQEEIEYKINFPD